MLEETGQNALANPYTYFRCCCVTFHTKQHAQMTGVMSFSLFICMVVISLYAIGSLSIFYITVGVIVYSFLMRAVFHSHAEKFSVLAYLIFESMQIGLLAALIVYLVMPVFFGPLLECGDAEMARLSPHYRDCNLADARGERARIQLLVCLVLLTSMKFYFTRVFARFYKYLLWDERKNSSIHAQYWNSRGVRINVDDVFAATSGGRAAAANGFSGPPHVVWTNNGSSYVLNLGTLPSLPSYNQLVKPGADGTSPPPSLAALRGRCSTLPPPTWDGEVSCTPITPPTYVLPTPAAAAMNAPQPQLRSRNTSVLQQEIPIGAATTEAAESDEHPPPIAQDHVEPKPPTSPEDQLPLTRPTASDEAQNHFNRSKLDPSVG